MHKRNGPMCKYYFVNSPLAPNIKGCAPLVNILKNCHGHVHMYTYHSKKTFKKKKKKKSCAGTADTPKDR